ncbi:MAG: hypothetical protein NPIRA02_31630 [Nitrospirales bacterium]|nr:MAG: hypothetical protein NPIRA02_31630 [Nitrospirales bacterium]
MTHTCKIVIGLTTLLLGLLSYTANTSAHFVWIESPSALSTNQFTIVKAYFGEYNEQLKEQTGGRLDERAGLTSWLIEPNGTKRALDMTKESNHFQIPITLRNPGIYNLLAINQDEPVRDGTPYPSIGMLYKPMFYARTQFSIVDTQAVSAQTGTTTETLPLDIIPRQTSSSKTSAHPTVNEELAVQVIFQGRPLSKATPVAHAPNGWSKELQTNDSGVTQFTPLWPGTYVIDYINLETTPGHFNDQPYEAIRHRATLTIQVTGDQ